MNFEDFAAIASSAMRHELVNAIFVVRAYFQMGKSKEEIELAFEKIDTLMNLWKNMEGFGSMSFWQSLRSLLIMLQMENKESVEIKIEIQDVKIKTNTLFVFILRNLIENTIRYSGKEKPIISISSREEQGFLVIFYRDNGVGISKEDKKRIFNRGYGKNTGLGMFFCSQIIAAMGGNIIETGVPGEGICIEIRIPEDIYKISNSDL